MSSTLLSSRELLWLLSTFDRCDIDVLTSVSRLGTRRIFSGVEDMCFGYGKVLGTPKGLHRGVLLRKLSDHIFVL